MTLLQKPLFANFLFSGTSGLLLVLFAQQIATHFGTNQHFIFMLIGIGLLFFSLSLILAYKNQRPQAILFIILQDLLWVVGSFALILIGHEDISTFGLFVISGVAVIVLCFALLQINALMKVDQTEPDDTKQLTYSTHFNADPATVWSVISDIANYHTVAPNIDDVRIISGEGEGMVRKCSHKKDSWMETCTLWEEEKRYIFNVDTKAKDYPYPFAQLQGTWEMEPATAEKTEIRMIFDFTYRKRYQNWLLHPFLRTRFASIVDELLENWRKTIQSTARSN